MSRSNRGDHTKTGLIVGGVIAALLVAYVIIGWGLSRDAEYQRQADNRTREYSAYTNQQIRQSCLPLVGNDEANCIAKRDHEQRANERDEQDLVAQRKSANWAYLMGAAAVVGVMLSIVGVILVWTTFRESRRTANAALEANKISNRVAEAELRPYLFVERLELIDIRDESEPIYDEHGEVIRHEKGVLHGKVVVHFRNYGKVPARNIKVHMKRYMAEWWAGRFTSYWCSSVDLWLCAPSHERRAIGHFFIRSEDRRKFDVSVIYLVVRIRYSYTGDGGPVFNETAAFQLSGDNLTEFFLLTPPYGIKDARKRREQQEFELAAAKQRAAPKKRAPRKPRKRPTPRKQ